MISVLTNFGPEHLKPADPHNPNHHPSLSHYWNSKLKIARHQAKDHVFIINSKLKTKIQKEKLKGKIVYFGKSNLSSKLPGEHNKENIAAATEVARIIGIPKQSIAHTVKNFKGLPYRLERLGEKNNIEYYNDSFSTVPDSTITAINSFSKPIVLLAGGADKDSNFTALAKLIKKRITYLVLFKGPGTNRLLKFLQKINYNKKNTVVVNSMKDAVRAARKKAVPGTIILLSPACASFGVFKNYKDRGNQFKQEFLRQK
jgi:UDP-N-acetylmuramoylalanine--D-glutamate ligase